VHDDVWYEVITNEDKTLSRMQNGLREGVEALGGDTPAGARVEETIEFLEFMQNELRLMRQRWREYRDEVKRQDGSAA
jgi:hypothetical protein